MAEPVNSLAESVAHGRAIHNKASTRLERKPLDRLEGALMAARKSRQKSWDHLVRQAIAAELAGGETQASIARRAGVSKPLMRVWLLDSSKRLRSDKFEQIAVAMGFTISLKTK